MAVVASFQSGLMPACDVGQSCFELCLHPDVCEARGMLPVTLEVAPQFQTGAMSGISA